MKKSYRVLSFLLVLILLSAPRVYADTSDLLNSTFSTPYGASVPIAYYVGDVISGKDHWDVIYENLEKYPGISYVSDASPYYNCYTYALIFDGVVSGMHHMSSQEIFNINDPNPIFNNSPCYSSVSRFDDVLPGDIIIYNVGHTNFDDVPFSEIHVGIIQTKAATFENCRIVSKWGNGAVYNHNPLQTPYNRYAYKIGTSGSTVYLPTPEPHSDAWYVSELIFTFGRISHINITYSQIIKNNGTVNSTHHRTTCTGCGAYHNESHDSDEYEAIVTKVGSLTVSTDHKILCSKCGYYNGQEDHEIEVINNFAVCIKCGYNTGVMQNNVNIEEQCQ